MELYIYYRVPCAKAAQLQTAVLAMQAALSREHGVKTQLKRRPEAKGGCHTWMEIYTGAAEDFEVSLADAVAHATLGQFIDGDRRAEKFMDATSCA